MGEAITPLGMLLSYILGCAVGFFACCDYLNSDNKKVPTERQFRKAQAKYIQFKDNIKGRKGK